MKATLVVEKNGNIHINGQFARIRIKQTNDGTRATYCHPLGWSEPVALPHNRYALKYEAYEGKKDGVAGRKQLVDDVLKLVGIHEDGRLGVERACPYYQCNEERRAQDIWAVLWVAMSAEFAPEEAIHVSALVSKHYRDLQQLPALITRMCKRMQIGDAAIDSIIAAVQGSLTSGKAKCFARNPYKEQHS